jgi:hypothetical protein
MRATAGGHARHGGPRNDVPVRAHALRRRQTRRSRGARADLAGGNRRQRHEALDDLYAQLIWIPDGDNEPLSEWARRYRDIIGPPDPPPNERDGGEGEPGRRGGHAGGAREGNGDGERRADVGSLKDALERACERSRAGQLQQLDEDADLAATLDRAARRGERPSAAHAGAGTGAPTGRMPDRGVDRPPFPDEVREANRIAQLLLRARSLGLRRIDKRTPGGRCDGRAYARGRFDRATGRLASSRPWTITREITAPLEEPYALLVIDTSGSMSAYEYALGPIVWILTTAFRAIGGQGRHRPVRQRRRPAQRRHRADAQDPGDARRRRHRLRRQRHRDRRRPR